MTLEVETAVVGAGISGLAYAFGRDSRRELIVLEAEARAGGSIWTLREDDLEFEWGPEALQTGTPDKVKDYAKQMIDEVGKDGGFIMSSRGVLDEANPELVKVWVEFTKEYGVYK